ncbi:hypothetical protein CLU79DRAFT_65172 [Phycomyces nitens]|nr:hypothetical protein CLU79DRAFT_65172 [Phycomyces nitens]
MKRKAPEKENAQPTELKKSFLQTRLFFAPLPADPPREKRKAQATPNRPPKKQHTIQMTVKKGHPIPCPVDHCNATIPRLECSAITTSNQPCVLSFCENCVERLYGETRESIEAKTKTYVTSKGSIIRHRHEAPLQWACPVCRDTCVCK